MVATRLFFILVLLGAGYDTVYHSSLYTVYLSLYLLVHLSLLTTSSQNTSYIFAQKMVRSTCLCFQTKRKKLVCALFEECVSLGGWRNDWVTFLLYSSQFKTYEANQHLLVKWKTNQHLLNPKRRIWLDKIDYFLFNLAASSN